LHANQVQKADLNAVEDAIRCGGLAQIKAARIANILNTLLEERGSICLEYVRNMTSDQIKAELSRFKGVGPKTVACVLMFHLEHNEFPVDTHVIYLFSITGPCRMLLFQWLHVSESI
jgi:endonuclease-3